MKISKNLIVLLLTLVFFFIIHSYTFREPEIYWYLYPFIILICVAISIVSMNQKDDMPIWKCFIFGLGYGVILYGIIRLLYILLNSINKDWIHSITKYITTFGPSNIWHYLILIFIVVVGEELFWRGFVQQRIKDWTSPFISIVISSLLFAGAYMVGGYFSYGMIIFVIGLIVGSLYEWKKSMPLIIVVHEVFVILFFLLIPFT